MRNCCVYATNVNEAAALIKDARARAGLSTRAMAQRAGVTASTVSRVESGLMDPTLGTLQKLMAAVGCELVIYPRRSGSSTSRAAAAPSTPALADLHDAWRSTPQGVRPDWTRIRAFLDYLALHPELVAEAIKAPPRRTRSQLMNALLAGIADKLADDSGVTRPSWTRAAGALTRRWYSPGTPRMRQKAREEAPRQLMARNIAIREDSLWRPQQRLAG